MSSKWSRRSPSTRSTFHDSSGGSVLSGGGALTLGAETSALPVGHLHAEILLDGLSHFLYGRALAMAADAGYTLSLSCYPSMRRVFEVLDVLGSVAAQRIARGVPREANDPMQWGPVSESAVST